MLHISASQISELSQSSLDAARAYFIKHLVVFAPERSRSAGPDALESYVDAGISDARARGLWQRGPMRLWLEAGVILGASFAADPQYARLMPSIDPLVYPMPFAERLYRGLSDYMNTCFGPGRSTLKRVLRDLASVDFRDSIGKADDVLAELVRIWPEKLEWTGEERLHELVLLADARAVQLGLDGPDGRALCAMLSIGLGAGFAEDPLHPWLIARLSAPTAARTRAASVRSAVRAYSEAAARALMARGG